MLVVPLPEMGHPVPVCQGCFDGKLLGGYTLGEDGRMRCDGCCPAVEVGDPPHPWPYEVRKAVESRVLAQPLPCGFEVTAYNLVRYTKAATAHPEWLGRIVSWLQLTPDHEEPEARGNWVGAEKERVLLKLRMDPPEAVFLGTGDWGDRYLFRFRDEAGNRVVWFTTEKCPIPDGWEGWLKATVKEHSVYGGEKQTVITRGTVSNEDGTPVVPRKKKEPPPEDHES